MSVYAAIAVAFVLTCAGLTVLAICGFLNQHLEDSIRRVGNDRTGGAR